MNGGIVNDHPLHPVLVRRYYELRDRIIDAGCGLGVDKIIISIHQQIARFDGYEADLAITCACDVACIQYKAAHEVPLSREERRTLINFRLDPFPFPFEERGETVFLDISALNKDSALFLLVDSKFFHNELRKIGSRLVLKNVRGTPRLYVRSISWARRDTWLADLVAARKYKHWHAAFFRCVRLANEEPPLLDYRTANASVSWLSADARSNDIDKLSSKDGRNDPAMEIGNRYAAQFIQEEP
jgi:hypothetical protein